MGYPLIAGFVVLGVLCGGVLRLGFFLVFLATAVAAAFIGSSLLEGGIAWVPALITLVALQVGYGLGVILRAAIRSFGLKTPELGSGDQGRSLRSRMSQKQR